MQDDQMPKLEWMINEKLKTGRDPERIRVSGFLAVCSRQVIAYLLVLFSE